MTLVFLDDLDAIVRAASVHDDVFQLGILLAYDRQDRLLQETALVVGRRDDGHLLEAHLNFIADARSSHLSRGKSPLSVKRSCPN